MVCRVSCARIEQKVLPHLVSLHHGGRRYEQTGGVTSVGGNRYTGWVYNEQFNERGNVVLYAARH